jgi:hypothetical protein
MAFEHEGLGGGIGRFSNPTAARSCRNYR